VGFPAVQARETCSTITILCARWYSDTYRNSTSVGAALQPSRFILGTLTKPTSVSDQWAYLYRTVDATGKTVGFRPSPRRKHLKRRNANSVRLY